MLENPYRALSKINPQKEGHHREIANVVFDALVSARLSGGEYQVVLSIIERTWGHPIQAAGPAYSRVISLGYFAKATNLSRQGVIDAIYSLEKKRIIAVERSATKGSVAQTEYLFNKHYDTWLVKQTLLVEGEPLVKQSLPDQSSRVDHPSQAELTRTSQVPEPSTVPDIENIERIESIERGKKSPTKHTKQKKERYILPEWINKDTWKAFLDMRRKKRAVPTERAVQLLIKELEKLKNEGHDPNEVLNQSIMRNYTGVFPLKGGQGGAHKQRPGALKERHSYTRPEDYR